MPFNPMEGPVTIPMEGISLQCMYDRLDYVIALSIAQVRGKEYTPLRCFLHDMVAEPRL